MAKSPCKGVKKDGAPCRGNGLEQLDGYCIAHASPEKTRAWRVRGGENSSTAARADKRIPERLRGAIDQVRAGMTAVKKGDMTPAAFNAICRGANTLVMLHKAADSEMDEVRAEENAASAAAVNGIQGDLEILESADELSNRHERYHVESLMEQGLVELGSPLVKTPARKLFRNQPVLTDAGRLRFGNFPLIDAGFKLLTETEEEFNNGGLEKDTLANLLAALEAARDMTKSSRGNLDRLPSDPFTGQPGAPLPNSVDRELPLFYDQDDDPAKLMDELLKELDDLIGKMQNAYQEKMASSHATATSPAGPG